MATVTAKLRSGMRTELTSRQFTWLADEPPEAGGSDTGPTPYEILVASLAACVALTLRWWADRHDVALEGVDVETEFDRVHAEDCEECEKEEGSKALIDRIRTKVRIYGDFDEKERARLEQIVSRCPVHRTLERGPQIFDSVEFGPSA